MEKKQEEQIKDGRSDLQDDRLPFVQRLNRLSAQLAADTQGYRQWIHAHPDLSGQEQPTAAFVAERLRSFGIEPQMLLEALKNEAGIEDEVRMLVTREGLLGRGGDGELVPLEKL